ncbi:cysteine peptidase family C39 domain-containing protein [Oceanobacillus sp. FSL W7-1293]|uniref:cysteine peptidase family C39 domain-containing protein n=1 Tax=Oceanobacillus sp. FSL W7-1293 TaxID=2921699 RepID=UPI0030D143C1
MSVHDNYFKEWKITFCYYVDNKEEHYYVVNGQQELIMKIIDPAQINLVKYCTFARYMDNTLMDWLFNKSGYKYFESVEDYISDFNQFINENKPPR